MPEARLKDATSLVKLQGKSRSKGKYIKKKKKRAGGRNSLEQLYSVEKCLLTGTDKKTNKQTKCVCVITNP